MFYLFRKLLFYWLSAFLYFVYTIFLDWRCKIFKRNFSLYGLSSYHEKEFNPTIKYSIKTLLFQSFRSFTVNEM